MASNPIAEAATESKAAAAAGATELTLLERIVQEGNMAVEPSQSVYAKKLIGQLASQILDEGMRTSPDKSLVATINERVAEIDQLISDQLNAIMHDPDFQALEASWTGLHDMVYGTETGQNLKLRLLNVSKRDLL
ncbi:type VI secretion system contractile sheath domain-containing protein, partial [Cupriavidus sp. TA19]